MLNVPADALGHQVRRVARVRGDQQHRPAQRQGLDHGAPESLGPAGQLQHQIGNGHHIPDIRARRRNHQTVGHAPFRRLPAQAVQVGFPARLIGAEQNQGAVQAAVAAARRAWPALDQTGEQLNGLGVTLQARAAAGQQQQAAPGQGRKLRQPGPAPVIVGLPSMRPLRRFDATFDDADAGIADGVMVQQVAAHRVRHGNDMLAPGHDRAVAVDRMQAMGGGNETWPAFPGPTAQGQPGQPGRQSRAGMDDVGAQALQQAAQARGAQQRQRGFFADCQHHVLAAGGFDLSLHATPGRDHHGPVSGPGKGLADLHGAALDATAIQCRQQLDDGQATMIGGGCPGGCVAGHGGASRAQVTGRSTRTYSAPQ